MKFLVRVRSAPVWLGLLESCIIAALLLFILARISIYLNDYAIFNGMVLFLGSGSFWASLRIPLSSAALFARTFREGWITILLTTLIYIIFWGAARLGGTDITYNSTSVSSLWILPFAGGVGFLILRLLWYLLEWWLRKRAAHFRWELASALTLVVVMVFVILGSVAYFLGGTLDQPLPVKEGAGPVTTYFVQILTRLFPAVALLSLGTLSIVAIGLPPFALFSYWAARRMTRRIDRLATAAAQMRAGDLSARVAVEGKDELAQLQVTFNEMACNLEETRLALERERDKLAVLLKSHRELSAMVSHELRTPVATLRGYLEISMGERVQSEADLRRTFDVMDQETLRLQNLIDDLFTLSRIETGALGLNIQQVDPCAVINRVVGAVAPLAYQSRKIEVSAALPDEPLPLIQADSLRLEQVLYNLIQNGIRHTFPGGIVVVQVSVVQDGLEIAVQDTGTGIPEEALEHIFKRFYQNPGSEDNGSIGLGLALVKELIEGMGGRVSVFSTASEGSRFCTWLPLHANKPCDKSATVL